MSEPDDEPLTPTRPALRLQRLELTQAEHERQLQVEQPASRGSDTTYKLGGATGAGWLPGQTGNPAGRPKRGESLADKMRAKGQQLSKLNPGSRCDDDIVEAAYKLATANEAHSVRALELWLDRVDGKVTQPVTVSQVHLVVTQEDWDAIP